MRKVGLTLPFALYAPYVVTLGLYFVGPVLFSEFSFLTLLTVLLGAIISLIGFSVGYRSQNYRAKTFDRHEAMLILWYRKLAPVILISAMGFVSWILARGTSLDLVLSSTGDVREITRGSDPIKQALAIFAYQAYGYIPILLTNHRKKFSPLTNSLMTIAIVLMAYAVVLQAGRTFFLVFSILVYASYISLPSKSRREMFQDTKTIILLVAFLPVSVYFIYLIAVQRVSAAEISFVLSTAEYRYFENVFWAASSEASYFFTVVSHYLVGPWSNFNILVQSEAELMRLSLGPLENVAGRIVDIEATGADRARQNTLAKYVYSGGQITGWRTGYGNMIIWYGYLGAFLLSAIISVLVGVSFRRARSSTGLTPFVRSTWLVTVFLMCIFYFPSDTIFWVNLSVVFFTIPFLGHLLRRTGPR